MKVTRAKMTEGASSEKKECWRKYTELRGDTLGSTSFRPFLQLNLFVISAKLWYPVRRL
jgi:hypothetical protein